MYGQTTRKDSHSRLAYMVEYYKLIARTQCRERVNYSTTDVLLSFVYNVQIA